MADTIFELPVLHACAPYSDTPAKLLVVNNRLVAQYDSANQALLFQNILTDKYIGGNIKVKIYWITNPYVAGAVTFELKWRRLAAGNDWSIETFNATQTLVTTSAGLSLLNVGELTFTNSSIGYSPGVLDELFQLLIKVTGLPALSKVQVLNVVLENV